MCNAIDMYLANIIQILYRFPWTPTLKRKEYTKQIRDEQGRIQTIVFGKRNKKLITG